MTESGPPKSRWFSFLILLAREMFKSGSKDVARQALSGETEIPALVEAEEKGRELDYAEIPESKKRERTGAILAFFCFAVAIAAGAAFIASYWTTATTQFLGGTLAVFFAGFGIAAVLYAHLLMPRKQATQPREPSPSATSEWEAAYATFVKGGEDVHRRGLLKWMIGIGATMFAAMAVSTFRSLGTPAEDVLYTTEWKRGQRLVDIKGRALKIDDLNIGDMDIVFPEDKIGSERAQTNLIRVDPSALQLPADRADWSTHGYVAYSRVCTHAGCAVGMWEKTNCQLACPCHQSTFDVLQAARPTGGPAARSLPQLPLYADEQGYLRAGGPFSNPPGPGFWGMPWGKP